jgi:hypothetical protein
MRARVLGALSERAQRPLEKFAPRGFDGRSLERVRGALSELVDAGLHDAGGAAGFEHFGGAR